MTERDRTPVYGSDEWLIWFATEFREGILDGTPSNRMCAAVCWPLSGLLRMHGIENEAIETDLGQCNHIWLRLADGRALDPTADQFNDISIDKLPPVYLGPRCLIHGALSDGEGRVPSSIADASQAQRDEP